MLSPALITRQLIRSGNGGNNYENFSVKDTISIAIGIIVIAVAIMLGFFIVGILGVNLLGAVNPSSYPAGSAQYNVSSSIVKGVSDGVSSYDTLTVFIMILVIIIIVATVIGVLMNKFKI